MTGILDQMISSEILEQAVSVVKTVWQKRGDKIVRKELSRLIATATPRTSIKVLNNASE